jgi:predicted ATPase/class 3 adenylate cyclase
MTRTATGTLTFLFTDIEGSTRLWQEHPESMPIELERHHALLRQSIEAHGGSVFKTMGDGVYSVFTEPARAAAAAVDGQRALTTASHVVPIRVRMALHTGEAQEREGDYFGLTLNRVSRILSAGHGGQVLLSNVTRDAIGAALVPPMGLSDLGEHRLRDLARSERIYQLLHPDLPSEFPPLRSLESFAHNLPVQLTSFINREQEIVDIRRLLTESHLVTLIGAGGCGKSRLALQVGAELVEEYADGVWLVELAGLARGAAVLHSVAATLGVPEEPGRPLLQTTLGRLRSRSLLLLLDNCEHLLPASAQLATSLLTACPHLRILATSREALAISGEQSYRVPSLGLPGRRRLPPVESLREYAGVHLFADRAARSHPSFAVHEANAKAVVQICHRLDGIPLAIELAAAHVAALPVDQIARRLDDRFRLLTRGSRTAPPRQQTLRSLIDWSYDLLTEKEQMLLRRLSVFAGGWTLEAAEWVCSRHEAETSASVTELTGSTSLPLEGIEASEVMGLLTRLVDQSLAIYEERPEPRYRLLETIRQYALEHLGANGEAEALRDRHLCFFLQTFEAAAGPVERGPGAWAGSSRTAELEHENASAALDWCSGREDRTVAGLRLAMALVWFWWAFGYLGLGRGYLLALLDRATPDGQETLRARAVEAAAKLAYLQHDLQPARALGEESLSLWRGLADPRGIIRSLRQLGFIAIDARDIQGAHSVFEESLARSRELQDDYYLALSLDSMGTVTAEEGDYATAESLHAESVQLYRRLEHSGGAAWALTNQGRVVLLRGEPSRALAIFREALSLRVGFGDRAGIMPSLRGVASALSVLGERDRAARLFGAAEALEETYASPQSRSEREIYDQFIGALTAAMETADLRRAWTSGHALSLEDAIALAQARDAGA